MEQLEEMAIDLSREFELSAPFCFHVWPDSSTMKLASGTMCVSFASSSYSGGMSFLAADLHMAREVAVLGISLYVLGFGLG